tara:strand:- start:15 stop:392 length:378 start_codon:yes stop_codon:yes gene_type:complete
MHDMLSRQKKKNVIKKFQQHEGDTGSTEVQIAILSSEINELVGHLKSHHKDQSSRRGLLRKIGERRRLLRYLEKENRESYEDLVKKLKLKQAKALLKKEKEDEKAAQELEKEDEIKVEEENGKEE